MIFTQHRDPAPLPVKPLDEASYKSALAEARRILDIDPVAPLDAVIHGVRVRLHTANSHWRRFWSANWFAPEQWATLTGQSPPAEPRIYIYAMVPDAQTLPWATYSREHNTAFLSGDTPYGPLRALALEAVARLLAEEEAVHFVPGLCLKEDEHGALLLRTPDLDPLTAIPTLLEKEGTHLIAWEGVFIRYGLVRMVDGVTLLPTLVIDEKGNQIPGYHLFPWLDEYGYWEPRADARCLTLEGEKEYCFARDLDLGRAPEAFAYPLEQAWYVPTQIVAAQPSLIGALWLRPEASSQGSARGAQPEGRGGLENVPSLTSELLNRYGEWARQATSSPSMVTTPSAHSLLEEMGQEKVMEALCRLRAAPQARAMVSPAKLWPGRAGGHPWRPVQIERVALMSSAGPTPLDPTVLSEHLISQDDDLTHMLERAIGGDVT